MATATKKEKKPKAPKAKKAKPCDTVPPEIVQAERDVGLAKQAWSNQKDLAKAAKEEYETSVKHLRQTIREFAEPNLFNGTGANGTNGVQDAGADDAWREEKIEAMNMSPSIRAVLANANIHTLGQLVDYTDPAKNDGWHRDLTDIKGIGIGAVAKIEEATTAYWAKHKVADLKEEVGAAFEAAGIVAHDANGKESKL